MFLCCGEACISGLGDNANLICLLIRKKRFEEAKWLAQDPTVDQQPGDSNSSGHRVPMVLDSGRQEITISCHVLWAL